MFLIQLFISLGLTLIFLLVSSFSFFGISLLNWFLILLTMLFYFFLEHLLRFGCCTALADCSSLGNLCNYCVDRLHWLLLCWLFLSWLLIIVLLIRLFLLCWLFSCFRFLILRLWLSFILWGSILLLMLLVRKLSFTYLLLSLHHLLVLMADSHLLLLHLFLGFISLFWCINSQLLGF